MSKHTAGPWTIREVTHSNVPGQTAYAIDFNEDQEQVVDWVYEKADAILISAAPEMLKALELVVSRIKTCLEGKAKMGGGTMLRLLDESIPVLAKARGEA